MTADGINANKITAGSIDTSEITIMNGVYPSFRWDDKGITAFDFTLRTNEAGQEFSSNFSVTRGVRFDRFGIYGFDGENGQTWSPNSTSDIVGNDKVKFALTWEGLKVTGNDGITALFGKHSIGEGRNAKNYILNITNNNNSIFSISTDGDLKITGEVTATSGKIGMEGTG
jgi:hypothetical protein